MKTLAIPEMKIRETKEHKYCLVFCFFIFVNQNRPNGLLKGT